MSLEHKDNTLSKQELITPKIKIEHEEINEDIKKIMDILQGDQN